MYPPKLPPQGLPMAMPSKKLPPKRVVQKTKRTAMLSQMKGC